VTVLAVNPVQALSLGAGISGLRLLPINGRFCSFIGSRLIDGVDIGHERQIMVFGVDEINRKLLLSAELTNRPQRYATRLAV
jgi:hypothetical protein